MHQPTSHRWARILVVTALTLGLLGWALRGISFVAVWDAVKNADFRWLALGVATLLGSFAIRAHRWGTLLAASGCHGSFSIRHAATYIGFAGNCILPAHAGELARASTLKMHTNVPFGTAIGSIFTERLLDALVVFVFLFAPLLPGATARLNGSGANALQLGCIGGALVAVCTTSLAAARWRDPIARLARCLTEKVGLGRLAPRIESSVGSLLRGLEALRHPRVGIRALGESFVIWILTALTYWSGMVAFGITSPGMTGALFVQSAAAIGVAIPSSPGYFGPYEAAIRLALSMYAVPVNLIIAYALTLHFLIFTSVILIGCACAMRLGVFMGRASKNNGYFRTEKSLTL